MFFTNIFVDFGNLILCFLSFGSLSMSNSIKSLITSIKSLSMSNSMPPKGSYPIQKDFLTVVVGHPMKEISISSSSLNQISLRLVSKKSPLEVSNKANSNLANYLLSLSASKSSKVESFLSSSLISQGMFFL